jgi:hypothetical protein
MRRTAVRVLASIGLLTVALGTAGVARAAGDVVVAVSPTSTVVGKPIEVLVRTFRPVERSGLALPFESPIEPYPVPSDVWNVLYPWPDYPFDVVAQHEDGTELQVTLTRDPSDSTVWRGSVILPKVGSWTIWVRNFQHKELGSTAMVTARAEPSASVQPVSGSVTPAVGSIEPVPAALIGAVLGLVGGFLAGRLWRRRRASGGGEQRA